MRKRSPGDKANRDRKFFEKHAMRESPIRFAVALPDDIDLLDIAWQPTTQEKQWERLAELDRQFAQIEIAYLKRKIAAYEEISRRDAECLPSNQSHRAR